jgi:hypothetical protein
MKLITILLAFTYNGLLMAQEFKDSLYLHLYNYQLISGEIKINDIDVKDLKSSFYVKELAENENIDSFKIYKFYNLRYTESLTDFLVIEGENIEIYNLFSYRSLIEKILDLNICDKKKLVWVKEMLKIYDDFNNIDIGNNIMRKQYGKYKYFIPLNNMKNESSFIK